MYVWFLVNQALLTSSWKIWIKGTAVDRDLDKDMEHVYLYG